MSDERVSRFLTEVDSASDEIVAFVQELIALRTESQDPAASHFLPEADRCRDVLDEFLTEDGFETQRWEARAVSFDRHPVLAGKLAGAGTGRSIALNGHFDVVPAGDMRAWDHDARWSHQRCD